MVSEKKEEKNANFSKEIEEKAEYVIFIVNGGIGKNIQATVPLRGLKKKYPEKKIVVVCSYPDVFKFNPNVHRAYVFKSTPNFYDDYVIGGKAIVVRSEPYFNNEYINKKRHITELWCEEIGVPFDNPIPDLHFTKKEINDAKNFIRSKSKPVLLMQFNGGMIPQKDKPLMKQFVRNIPIETAKQVSDIMSEKYHIIVMQAPTQPIWPDVEVAAFPLRLSLALVGQAHKLLLIDSMAQHAAAAAGKPAVVCWAGTSPLVLGYDMHTNLRNNDCPDPECHRPNSYLFDVDSNQAPWECPYGETCTQKDVKEIVDALNKIKGGI